MERHNGDVITQLGNNNKQFRVGFTDLTLLFGHPSTQLPLNRILNTTNSLQGTSLEHVIGGWAVIVPGN